MFIIAVINTATIVIFIMSAFLTRARTLLVNVDGFMVSVMMTGLHHVDENDDQLMMTLSGWGGTIMVIEW